MKIVLIYVAGRAEGWAGKAEEQYREKINYIFPIELKAIKAKSNDRDSADYKREAESAALLSQLESTDEVWLLDERGRMAENSHAFSKQLVRSIESGKKRLVMIIGGPFGTSEELKRRAQKTVSLSPLTMNHHLAKVVLLEQMYRALTIWRGLPYHN